MLVDAISNIETRSPDVAEIADCTALEILGIRGLVAQGRCSLVRG